LAAAEVRAADRGSGAAAVALAAGDNIFNLINFYILIRLNPEVSPTGGDLAGAHIYLNYGYPIKKKYRFI
jgi:hypothetical protein